MVANADLVALSHRSADLSEPVTTVSADDGLRSALAEFVGRGPSVEALDGDIVVTWKACGDWSEQCRHEDSPGWTTRVVRAGIRSVLCFPLPSLLGRTGAPFAVLSFYGRQVFAPEDHLRARLMSGYAHRALTAQAERDRVAIENSHLRAALRNRDVIGQAKGIVMERHDVGSAEAFALLRRVSQSSNIKLSAVAEIVVGRRNTDLLSRHRPAGGS